MGDVLQEVPPYSAIKIKGRRFSDLVRDGHHPKPKARVVHIDSIKVKKFTPSVFPEIDLEVKCRKGTYVRSLCNDLASALCKIVLFSLS